MRGKACAFICSSGNFTCLCLLFISALYSVANGQPDPQGVHDSSYVDCGTNLYPGSGNYVATFDIKFSTDNTYPNRVSGYNCPVKITVTNNALVMVDTTFNGVLGGTALASWSASVSAGPPPYNNPTWSPFHLAVGGVNFSNGLNPGTYTMIHIRVTVDDTCTVYLDTLSTEYLFTSCVTEQAEEFDFAWGGRPGFGYPPGGTRCFVLSCSATYATGTGYGVGPIYRSHIDTWFTCSSYQLVDNMRKEIYKDTPGHTHNGRMSEVGAVITQISGFGIPIDPDNYWNSLGAQAAAVDAHVYAGLTYDYMNLTLARNGFEDSGNGMITIVEVQGQFDNATFDTTSKAVLITQPGPGHFSIAGALDVVAHEWGHGIIWRTSNLDIPGEPGSLDESFAWMFGAAVEYAYEGPSSMWKCGEDIYRNGNYDYDMANPHQSPLDPQPDTYGPEDEYWIDVTLCQPTQYNEYCWRWHNAGIPNKMFYLLANGGTHNGVAVTGIGVANAMEIMYEANRKRYWTELTDFVHAATGSIRAAFDLNYISNWPQQTSRAWTAVKVCTIMPGDLDASGYVSLPDVIRLVNFLFDKDRPATSCLGSSPGNCWTPDPLCRAEMDASGNIRLPDVIWLVNFVFDKDRPGLSCLGTGSIPCWLPIPTDYCCKLP